ncbi:MAG TPA: hypothetical protein VLL96_01040 [Candidatus Deferrimicrobiaceae bacterium]|nr:hypothetical protein [Candidatus Deferrimicrobiaceae bacterium]
MASQCLLYNVMGNCKPTALSLVEENLRVVALTTSQQPPLDADTETVCSKAI